MRAFLIQNANLALVGALAMLAGCATPQFQTTVRYVPPADAAGRACIRGCEAEKAACQADCQARYAACAQGLDAEAETRYTEALKQYETDLKRYAAALRRYEMDLRFEWLHAWPARHPYRYPYWWDPWPWPSYPPPPEPTLPTREAVRAELEKTRCQADCGCLPAYDACFTGCGGQRISETVCVKNCPPGK
ncbi:MAG: hypothetical protein AB1593_10240 [Pseudomonadota bacterium]